MNFNQRLLTFFVIFLSMVIESIDAKASTWLEYNNYDITWFSKDQKEFSLNNSKQIAGLAFIVNNQISNFKGCKINLANDIDLGSYDWIPIGSSEFAFEGNFDGNGYKISRIKISKYDSDYIGFFGMIKNNSIKNFYITGTIGLQDKGSVRCGMISGKSVNANIENLRVEISINLSKTEYEYTNDLYWTWFQGGVVGDSEYSNFSNIISSLNVQDDLRDGLPLHSRKLYTGGIVGKLKGGQIKKCVTTNIFLLDLQRHASSSEEIKFILGGVVGLVDNIKSSDVNPYKIIACSATNSVSAKCKLSSYLGTFCYVSGVFKLGGILGSMCDDTETKFLNKDTQLECCVAINKKIEIVGTKDKYFSTYSIYGGVLGSESKYQPAIFNSNFSNSDCEKAYTDVLKEISGVHGTNTYAGDKMLTQNFINELNQIYYLKFGEKPWILDRYNNISLEGIGPSEKEIGPITTIMVNSLKYRIDPSTLNAVVVKQLDNNLSGEISIPERINYNGSTYVVTEIGDSAFINQSKITGINISSEIEKIGNYAFMGMRSLTSMEIPDNVKSIGRDPFSFCSLLESVYLGSGLYAIGIYPFWCCPKLSSIKVSDKNQYFTSDGSILYSKDYSTVYKVSETMAKVTLDPSVQSISNGCFGDNDLLENIDLPSEIITIAAAAFKYCDNLKSIDIPDKVKNIYTGAFAECKSLKTIKIGKGVELIGQNAFATGSNYPDVYIRSTLPPTIDATSFDNYASTLYVPVGCKNAYSKADSWNKFQKIVEFNFDGVVDIVLSEEKLEMNVGDTHALTYTITPAEVKSKLIWTSSDSNVATVENGVITAVGPGNATITCTADDGNKVSASCQVTVKDIIKLVESIELNYSNIELKEREGIQLIATINPVSAINTSITWSSSDKTVAIVDDEGYVATLKPGSVTITCMANDGSGVSASCQVTVIKRPVPVDSIELNHDYVELAPGEGIQLTAKINPESATDTSVTWVSSDKSVAVVDRDGFVAALKEGTATITCKVNDGSGVTASCKITVIEDNAVDSIFDGSGITVETDNGQLRIHAHRHSLVNIYSMNGILIRRINLEEDETVEINLTSGMYIVNGVKYIVD